jgi:hypothetical protein
MAAAPGWYAGGGGMAGEVCCGYPPTPGIAAVGWPTANGGDGCVWSACSGGGGYGFGCCGGDVYGLAGGYGCGSPWPGWPAEGY